MALTVVTPTPNENMFKDDRPDLPPPPAVATTPCDPWPAPYRLERGLRRIDPYYYTYNTYCKQRWRGREILDIFATEFRDRTKEYYQQAIEEGRIVLNGKPCQDVHTPVQNGDIISHTLHRHEPPVSAQPIRAIYEDDNMVVIDKPAGVPVHPAGRYKFNSVVEIMRAERNAAFNPLPCNRLDRLTSGVMFIGKTGQKAEAISGKLRARTVRKEYVARVKGRFPDGDGWDGDPMRGGVVKCDEPILQISPVLGLNRARASGKSAKTLFRRIAYYAPEPGSRPSSSGGQEVMANGTSNEPVTLPPPPSSGNEDAGYSIVHCLPLTGRTHQIRVHLQFLGCPISNDPIYSNRRVFGADLAKNDNSSEKDAEIVERLSKMGKTEVADAYSYSQDEKANSKKKTATSLPPTTADISTLIDQTQQITLSDAIKIEEQQRQLQQEQNQAPQPSLASTAGARASATPTPTPTKQLHFKPLPQSLHAGPLPDLTNTSSTESDPLHAAYVAAHDEAVADYNRRKGEKLTGQYCPLCQTPLYSDPGPQELGIYLHALAYADLHGEWKYRSPMPEWAKPPAHADGPTKVDEWVYEGEAAELLDIGDEKENEKKQTFKGMKKNRELGE